MSEPNFGNFIVANRAMIMSHALALNAARLITASEIAAVYRKYAEQMENGHSRADLLSCAKTLEGLEGEPQTTPRWTPEVVPGGKDDSREDGGGEAD